MRVNLSQFLLLSAEDRAKVTHLDLHLDDDPVPYHNRDIGASEEYLGEAAGRKTDKEGYNR